MPWPYSTGPARGTSLLDAWLPRGAWRLEHHFIDVAAAAGDALDAVGGLRLRDVPAVGALFSLRGLPYRGEMSLREFFSTSPFLVLGEEASRELVFGVVGPFWQWRRGSVPLRVPGTPAEMRAALADGRMAAIGNFRADPAAGGSRLWTETWVYAPRPGQRALFTGYWLLVGPFSAWIRRIFLRAAARRAPGISSPLPHRGIGDPLSGEREK